LLQRGFHPFYMRRVKGEKLWKMVSLIAFRT
jgi:hypothetical protein